MLGERSGSERAEIASVGEGDPREPGDPGRAPSTGSSAAGAAAGGALQSSAAPAGGFVHGSAFDTPERLRLSLTPPLLLRLAPLPGARNGTPTGRETIRR